MTAPADFMFRVLTVNTHNTHVPAGLGVLEAVFVALLAHRVPQGELLAALLAYRAIYLAPLAIAAALFFVVDAEAAPRRCAAGSDQPVSVAISAASMSPLANTSSERPVTR